jgi:hypothetical protein
MFRKKEKQLPRWNDANRFKNIIYHAGDFHIANIKQMLLSLNTKEAKFHVVIETHADDVDNDKVCCRVNFMDFLKIIQDKTVAWSYYADWGDAKWHSDYFISENPIEFVTTDEFSFYPRTTVKYAGKIISAAAPDFKHADIPDTSWKKEIIDGYQVDEDGTKYYLNNAVYESELTKYDAYYFIDNRYVEITNTLMKESDQTKKKSEAFTNGVKLNMLIQYYAKDNKLKALKRLYALSRMEKNINLIFVSWVE